MTITKDRVIEVLDKFKSLKNEELQKATPGAQEVELCQLIAKQKFSLDVAPTIVIDGEEYTIDVKACYTGAEDGSSERYVIFLFEEYPDILWRITGYWDSWSESSWDDVSTVHQVIPRPVVTMLYERVEPLD